MSATLADPYRGFAINYSHHTSGKADHHNDLITYDLPQSPLRHDKPTEAPFHSNSIHSSSFGPRPEARVPVLPHAVSQSPVHHDPEPAFIAAHQMLPRQLPAHYTAPAYEISPSQSSRKRSRSENEGDDNREANRRIGIRQTMQALLIDGHAPASESSDMLFPVHADPSSSHPSSAHDLASPISLPLPQHPQHHHHHRLPAQASLHSGHHGTDSGSSPSPVGPPSAVGQPGMPDPAPRPRGPKLKFTPEEDALLVELKENKNLTWRQIADFFPGRTSGTLQVRYCTKLKAKDVIWSDDMVQRLQHAIDEYENDRWRIISGKVGNGFTPAACRERASHFE